MTVDPLTLAVTRGALTQIADEMDLELAGVYAALAYYHLNRDEIEADISANSEEAAKRVLGKPPSA